MKRAFNRIDRIEPSRSFAWRACARAQAGRCVVKHPVRLIASQAIPG